MESVTVWNILFVLFVGVLTIKLILTIKEYVKDVKEIKEKDKTQFRDGIKRLQKIRLHKDKKEQRIKKEVENWEDFWKEYRTCEGCVFLFREDISTNDGEIKFLWRCLKYDGCVSKYGSGSLPICATPLDICDCKHLSEEDPKVIQKF